jgi:cytidylate kinase
VIFVGSASAETASSGKGTVARRVADALGYAWVDTGALYRAVGERAIEIGVDPRDAEGATRVARALRVRFERVGGALRVFRDDVDVTTRIRAEGVGRAASAVAVHPGVRSALLQTQRDLGVAGGVVMDGRDIGTVVLPDAELKIFLDASLDERARRRHGEHPGVPYTQVRDDLAARDAQDAGRAVAPLRPADDAVHIDTTTLTIDEVVSIIVTLARGARERAQTTVDEPARVN